jgi:hypothetical protein
MKRSAFPTLVLLFCIVTITITSGREQAKPTAPAPAPAAPPAASGKWVPPVKGIANVDVIQSPAKRVGKEIVTALKMKNTSTGAIHLLKVDQTWYDRKRAVISTAAAIHRKPFLPGEIIDLELKAPLNGQPDVNQITFAHANGKVNAKKVTTLQ